MKRARRTQPSPWRARPLLFLGLLLTGIAGAASAQTHTLEAGPDPAATSTQLWTCWTAPPGSSTLDYVALYPIGNPNSQYVTFAYTGGAESGCTNLFGPGTAGTYEVRYLLDNGFTDVATSNTVDVVDPPGFFSLSAVPTEAVVGQLVYACWTAFSSASPADTISLFEATMAPDIALATEGTGGTESGCVTFTAPAEGAYTVRYFSGGSLSVASAEFVTIPSPGSYTLISGPDPATSGRTLYACWTAPPGSSTLDYVALYPAGNNNTQYVNFAYTNGAESGCAEFFAPTPGTYEFRYLLNNGTTDVAVSDPISIVAPIGFFQVLGVPSEVVEGRRVRACWTAPAGSSTADAIGLFSKDPLQMAPLEIRGTCGAQSGCTNFTAPPLGDYEIRYLYDGSLDVAGAPTTSIGSPGAHSLTVDPAPVPSGGMVEVCWTAPPGSSTLDYVALYPLGNTNFQYVSFQYTSGTETGCTDFFTFGDGTYEFRYLLDNGFTDVASSEEIEFGNAPPLGHAHRWHFEVTDDPQDHSRFSVGQSVSAHSFLPREPIDQLPGDTTIGSYEVGSLLLSGFGSSWTFGGPDAEFSVLDDSLARDGVLLDAARGGRSVSMACYANSTLYADDGFKTDEVPLPTRDCTGASADLVSIQDSNENADVTGRLACIQYLPEPSLALAIGAGSLALSILAAGRRRRRD